MNYQPEIHKRNSDYQIKQTEKYGDSFMDWWSSAKPLLIADLKRAGNVGSKVMTWYKDMMDSVTSKEDYEDVMKGFKKIGGYLEDKMSDDFE